MYVLNLEFPDGSTASFNIELLTLKDQSLIFEQVRPREARSQKFKAFNLKQLLSGEGFNLEKYNRLVILRAVKGWSGLLNKHLAIIYNLAMREKWKSHGDGLDETEIPFSEDARRELSEMQSEYFTHWLDSALEIIRAMQKPALMRSHREKILAEAGREFSQVNHD